jgi:hypothetical protein
MDSTLEDQVRNLLSFLLMLMIVFGAQELIEIESTKALLALEFDMVDFGEAKTVLGMEITRDLGKGILTLSQPNLSRDILCRFNQLDSHPKKFPLVAGQKLSKKDGPTTQEERDRMATIPYRELVGSLIHLVNCTRPDLAFTVSVLSRFCSNPGQTHWEAALNCLKYLKGTWDWGLRYVRQPTLSVHGEVDANYAPGPDDRISGGGQVS